MVPPGPVLTGHLASAVDTGRGDEPPASRSVLPPWSLSYWDLTPREGTLLAPVGS